MPQSLTMRVGDSDQLRATGEVERWTSSNPKVVSVTDEDVFQGRPGGLLRALAPGRAQIVALGLSGNRLVEVEVLVGGAPAVTVAAGEHAALDAPPGLNRWTSAIPRVAEVDSRGQVHGKSPGITTVRGEGAGARAEFQVRVTGALEVEVNESVGLATLFDVPVRSWRVSSSSAARIDNQGVVTTGDRPRAVEVTATLENGETFAFDLRIISNRTDATLPTAGRTEAPALVVPDEPAPSQLSGSVSRPLVGVDDFRRGEVEAHLRQAEVMSRHGYWPQAGAELLAADQAATGDDTLKESVRRARERLRETVAERCADECATATAALNRGEYAKARTALNGVRMPSEQRALPESLRALASDLEKGEGEGDPAAEHPALVLGHLRNAWEVARQSKMAAVLMELAELAARLGLEDMAPAIARAAGDPSLGDARGGQDGLREALKQMGEAGFRAVWDDLGNTDPGDPAGPWLLTLLIELGPMKNVRSLVGYYAELPQQGRDRFVHWLAELAGRSAGAVLDLIAGVLRHLPPDRRLAQALQAKVGVATLEKEAVRWAQGGHAGARTVLERLYNYPNSAFSRL